MSIMTHISSFNCFGGSVVFAGIAVATAAAATPRGDDSSRKNTFSEVSESCPDTSSVRFDLPVLKAAFTDAVCLRVVIKGGAR